MTKSTQPINEILSLTLLLLLVMALVAGQADARIQDEVRAVAEAEFQSDHLPGSDD